MSQVIAIDVTRLSKQPEAILLALFDDARELLGNRSRVRQGILMILPVQRNKTLLDV